MTPLLSKPVLTLAKRLDALKPSVICQMTALAEQLGARNLAEGLPDFAPPEFLREALIKVASSKHTQQTDTPQGALALRQAIAHWLQARQGLPYCPESEITVTAGATEAFYLACAALTNPGDEVLLFEPFYECYLPVLQSLGCRPRFIRLEAPDFELDETELATFTDCKVVILNSPCNPTGHVWSHEAMTKLARWCERFNVSVISDEVYNHLLYQPHADQVAPSPAQHPLLNERTVVLNSLSKTFSATGWRVGFAAAPRSINQAIATLHETTTAGTSSLHQAAALAAFNAPASYYKDLIDSFTQRQEAMATLLAALNLTPTKPAGAYYYWVDASQLKQGSDLATCERLIREHGIASVPGRAFFNPDNPPEQAWLRFCFAKRLETLRPL